MRKIIVFGLPFLLLSLPLIAGAACGPNELCNPLGSTTLTQFLTRLLELVAQIGFPVIVVYIIYIGFKFIQASGNPEELTKVRGMLMWALIGALIVLGATVLAEAIKVTVAELAT
jgi:hypothetical protein